MTPGSVIVVGAGPGGLTSAMILAQRGFKVTVFEKKDSCGGRNAPLQLDEFTFDTGPTFLMMNFILKEMFEEAGRRAEDYLDARRLDPMYRLKFNDFELRPSSEDRARTRKQLRELFPGSDKGYDTFLRNERKRFEALFPCLQKSYSSLTDFLDMKLVRALPHLSLGRTMFQNLGDYFDSEDLRLAFTFQSKYLGMSAWECPAFFNIIPYVEHDYGIYHVIGGLNAVSGAMEKVLEEQGVALHKNTAVKKLVIEEGAAKGVALENGEVHAADDIIINADFAHAMTSIVEQSQLRKYRRKRFDRMKFSCSIFMIYLGVDKLYDIPHHNVFFARDYKKNVHEIFTSLKLSDDNSFYIQNACVTDSTLAPPGSSTVYILVPVPNQRSGIAWEKEKERFRDHILDQVERRTELQDLRQHIVAEKIITPEDWESDYSVFLGATFNLGHNLGQMLYLRPRNRFEEFDNCYLVGGGTHPGSGLPTIYESARISSNLLCARRGVPFRSPSTLERKQTFG